MKKNKNSKPMADNVLDQFREELMDDAFIDLLEQLGRDKLLSQIAEIIITENVSDELRKKRDTSKIPLREFSFWTISDKVDEIDKQMRRVEALLKNLSIMFAFHKDYNEDKEQIVTILAVLLEIFKNSKKDIDDLQEYLNERKAC